MDLSFSNNLLHSYSLVLRTIRFFGFCFFAAAISSLSADILRDKESATLGVGVSYFQPFGYFGEEFNPGIAAELNGRLPFSKFREVALSERTNLLLGANFRYANWNLKEKSTNAMVNLSLGIGPGIVYYLSHWFQPMAFVDVGIFYNRLALSERNTTYNAVNPFASVKAGFFTEISNQVFAEFSVSVPFYYLGQDNLSGTVLTFAMNYQSLPVIIADSPAEKLYLEGKRLYESRMYNAADDSFVKALEVDPNHSRAKQYRAKIAAQEKAEKARAALQIAENWLALNLMLEAANLLPELESEVAGIRQTLAEQIPKLVKEGIAAYEQKRYAQCELLMERVLLASPTDESAKIYLPRARSRRKALERLQ